VEVERGSELAIFRALEFGGAGRDRTGDLIVANDALSQLSYSPTCFGVDRNNFIIPNIRLVCRFKVSQFKGFKLS